MPKKILITDSAQNKAHIFVIFRVDLIITQQKISHAIWKKSLMDQKSVDCFAYREGRDSQKNPFWSKIEMYLCGVKPTVLTVWKYQNLVATVWS